MAGKSKKEIAARQRHMWVFVGLTGSLTATALLLHVLSPMPLAPAAGLAAQQQPEASRRVAGGENAVAPAPWKFIYIHHSGTATGDLRSLASTPEGVADHFVIGNGGGMADGEIQPALRWRRQLPATAPRGLSSLDQQCISICLVGDLDKSKPSASQLSQLASLIRRLQTEHRIPEASIYMRRQPGEPAGIGENFPIPELKQHLARR